MDDSAIEKSVDFGRNLLFQIELQKDAVKEAATLRTYHGIGVNITPEDDDTLLIFPAASKEEILSTYNLEFKSAAQKNPVAKAIFLHKTPYYVYQISNNQ